WKTVTPAWARSGRSAVSDMGRVTKCIVSGYNRDRVHYGSVYAPERRQLLTDFNGALPKGVTITKATWNTQDGYNASMSDGVVDGRKAWITLAAQYQGYCGIRLDVELSNGERYSVWHVIRILPAQIMTGDTYQNGPSQLIAVPAT
ncbi:hypothetical protein, partial [Stenotrophomonas sp.]|uniref:hypothetical protein n=1 Tax=Stenotrophomonas sp. TaxID=69392 RepID=UPI0028A1DCDE